MIRLTAIIVDHLGRVLLTEDPDTSTLTPPATHLPVGALPADALASALRESTGLIALPLRLTGVYAQDQRLTLAFRTILRGGAVAEVDGRPVAGYFDAVQLPKPMLPAAEQQVRDAVHHTGGAPVCVPAAASLGGRLRRLLGQSSPVPDPIPWEIRANLIVQGNEDQILWLRDDDLSPWRLPSVAVEPGAVPCAGAARLARDTFGLPSEPVLTGVYLAPDAPVIEFSFLATLSPAHSVAKLSGGEIVWHPASVNPPDISAAHQVQVEDALTPAENVVFRIVPS